MHVGVPKEIKPDEYRVGLVPAVVAELVARGHQVLVEAGAGAGAGFADSDYQSAGAVIEREPKTIYERADLIVKVKEPLAAERQWLRQGQAIFTYLHLAPDPEQTRALLASGVSAVAYETVTDARGTLPLLVPMSEVAGRMAPQVGAHYLERPHQGRGVLLGGVPGVAAGNVLILGAGTVGSNAALIAVGMGADVTVVARRAESLTPITAQFGSRVRAQVAIGSAIEALCRSADLVICAALVPGGAAPKLISAATVKAMKRGSVIVDVSIDQGGCAETSRPTTHAAPTYVVDGVVHYCVANMPGAVPYTSTFALGNATRPFVLALADKGVRRALVEDAHLRAGLNVHAGRITCRAVAEALKVNYVPALEALGAAQ